MHCILLRDDVLVAATTATAAALVIILVMTATTTATIAVAAMATATTAAVAAMATATAAATTAMMRLIKQLVDSGVADLNDFSRKAKNLARQFMVEIKRHCVIRDTKHGPNDALPLVIEHWHLASKDEKFLSQVAVGADEDILWDIDDSLGEARPIALVGRQRETELVSGFEVGNLLLESGEHSPGAIDKAERACIVTFLNEWAVVAVGMKLIDERHVFVLLDIHLDLV